MAKTSKVKKATPLTKWRTKWPRNGDLRLWMLCMIEKCEAISDPCTGSNEAHLPIEQLAASGYVDEALKFVNRFLRRTPEGMVLEIVRMAELGAEICLNAGKINEMEKYLSIALATEKYNKRKCDLGFSEQSVRSFRSFHGILDPKYAASEEERIEATFKRGERQFKEALANRQNKKALAAVAEMERAAAESKDEYERQTFLRIVVESFAKLNDSAEVKRCITRIGKEERDEILDYDTLWQLGMKPQSIRRAKREISQTLEELAEMDNPNIHFPVYTICNAIGFLFDHGESMLAKACLKRVLKDIDKWPVIELGWTTAAVYTLLAEVVAKVEGPAAAESLIANAHRDSKSESRAGFRKGAVAGILELEADLGKLDESIAKARKIRSPTERRRRLTQFLARAKRWKELVEVCSEATTPEEAANLCWNIKFELLGGEIK